MREISGKTIQQNQIIQISDLVTGCRTSRRPVSAGFFGDLFLNLHSPSAQIYRPWAYTFFPWANFQRLSSPCPKLPSGGIYALALGIFPRFPSLCPKLPSVGIYALALGIFPRFPSPCPELPSGGIYALAVGIFPKQFVLFVISHIVFETACYNCLPLQHILTGFLIQLSEKE